MTDEIPVTALDRTRTFEDREALARHVRELRESRGGLYDPHDQAAIRKLAELSNGNAPPWVAELARGITHVSPGKTARGPSPFDDRDEELAAEAEAREAEHREMDARIRGLEAEYEAERHRRIAEAERNPTKLARVERWTEARRMELEDLRAQRRMAREAARRARVARNALLKRRDRWHQDREARFMFDGEVVTLEQLHARLAERENR